MSFTTRSFARRSQVPVGSTAGAPQGNQSSGFDYATDDAAATVETAGYFNGARAWVGVGDKVSAVMAVSSGTPVHKAYVFLTVPATGNVTIGLQSTTAG